MTRDDCNRLRLAVAHLRGQQLGPTAIARRLGCARSTVHKLAHQPGPDRRGPSARRTSTAVAAELRQVAAADPTRGAEEIRLILEQRRHRAGDPTPAPSRSTI